MLLLLSEKFYTVLSLSPAFSPSLILLVLLCLHELLFSIYCVVLGFFKYAFVIFKFFTQLTRFKIMMLQGFWIEMFCVVENEIYFEIGGFCNA